MSRTSSANQNPYKDSVPFFDTFNNSPSTLQTAQFKSPLPPQDPDKNQALMVLMGAEFERLHGIIQVLVLRYKDLEAKFEAKDKENHDLRQKISSFDDSNAEIMRSKSQISDFLDQIQVLKARINEKDAEIQSLRQKTTETISPVVQTVKTEGGYTFAEKEVMPIRQEFANYNSEPIRTSGIARTSLKDPDIKDYDYYAKIYDAKAPVHEEEYYSPEKQLIESPGVRISGEFEYKEYKGESDFKQNNH